MRWLLLLLCFGVIQSINAKILIPPYFNLAEGKEIIASATCGVDTPGPELYCQLLDVSSDQDENVNLIHGQVCDVCDPTMPGKNHPPEHAVDGMETWWQSPPLSRGIKYNEVNLTINLGQEFHVAYVYIRMGNSPRPGLWVLEKSKDYGKTWQPWQYFSDSASDCITYFGADSRTPISRDDSVICTTEYSKIVPLEGGEISISILNNRPSASHYFNSTLLQEWTRATNVRFRFLRTKNLLGHLMSVARQDPTVTRRYFYSIKDISIGGRCMCNGHAATCDILDPKQPKKLECICQHNTYGPQCGSCLPGFQQKKWRISTEFKKFTCEPCNCFGHSTECIYDPEVDEKHLSLDIHGEYEGGGVCQNCAHNTQGINCNQCKPKYFRPDGKPLNATDVCQRCDCDFFYSTGNCAESTGKCECRQEFTAPDCDSCAYGYFGYPDCRPCECHLGGTDGYHCEATDGSCPCKQNYAGDYCNLCAEGYYKFPECLHCNCDARGAEAQVCNKRDGSCLCKEGYGGERCDQCINGYNGYPNCRPCNCSSIGSSSISCDANGKCSCLGNFTGRACDQCSPGYFMYPHCIKELVTQNREVYNQLNNRLAQNENKLLYLIDIAIRVYKHAGNLNELSVQMDDSLSVTRNTTVVRAVSAYRNIERAIQEAHEAAFEALQATNNATALSNGVDTKTSKILDRSMELLSLVEFALTATKEKLEADSDQALQFNNNFVKQKRKITKTLDHINNTLNQLALSFGSPTDDITEEANKIEQMINNAMDRISSVVNKILNYLTDSKNLTKDTTDSIRDVSQVKKQLESVSKVLPDMASLLSKLKATHKNIIVVVSDLKDEIEVLKRIISNARELADKVKIGVTFYRNTTLQLKIPERLPLLATSTKLSLYFRTKEANGLLLYLGNEDREKVTRQKNNDFLALTIEGGYPAIIIDLGSGPDTIINRKLVLDNVWRQIIVDRTGKNVKLTVREDTSEEEYKATVEAQIVPGHYSIFNLDQNNSKLFVGGYPTTFQAPSAVTASSFEGQIKDLVIEDIPVPFWNFTKGENNRESAMERDKLIDFTPNSGLRFDRNGFAVLSMKDSQIRYDRSTFILKMRFKTFAEDGLMYLMGNGKHFLALEMKNGQVLYQFNLGDGLVSLKSHQKYNDGQWHTLQIRRLGGIGSMEINNTYVFEYGVKGNGKILDADDKINVGGFPKNIRHSYKSVSKVGFEGCIDEVVILDTSIDLSRNFIASGVASGCPVRYANLVSFENDSPGYVKWQNFTADSILQVNLKFKTTTDNGLIFYVTDAEQTENSALSIEDGVLVFKSQGEEVTSSTAGSKFNDNKWHVVTATHNESALRIDIDDVDYFTTEYPPPALNIRKGILYIGGLPNAGSAFVGCIGDATLNGEIINFANTKERPNALLGRCQGGETPAHAQTESDIGVWPPPIITGLPETITMASTNSNIIEVNVDSVDPKNVGREERIIFAPLTEPPIITEEPKTPKNEVIDPVETTQPPIYTVDSCKLPHMPATDPESKNDWRFGTARYSRLEYSSLNGGFLYDYNLQIDLRTAADKGIIFYSLALTKNHFIAVYIQGGRVHYSFDCGTGPAWLKSDVEINDNQWHTINFKRSGNFGELIVDKNLPVLGFSQGSAVFMNVNPPFYVGGILLELSANFLTDFGINKTFNGCLRNFEVNGQPIGQPEKIIGVIPCSNQVETGLFFYPGNGTNSYRAMDIFDLTTYVVIEMEIKPRSASGHLLYIHGEHYFVLLEMVNGTIRLFMRTTDGRIETSFKPKMPNSLCDGFWHSIKVFKLRNQILLSVDDDNQRKTVQSTARKNTGYIITTHPVYIGGHPRLGKDLRGSTSHSQYVGCIRNIEINNNVITLDPERAIGHVTTGICPTI